MRNWTPVAIVLNVLAVSCTNSGTAPLDGGSSADASSSTNADAAQEGGFTATLVDVHAHIWPLNKEDNDKYIDDLAAVARTERVRIVLGLHASQPPHRPPTYSTDHDTWTLEAVSKYPDVYIPSLNGFDPADSASVEYVRTQLATGKWKVLGELDLRNKPKQTTTPANHANMMQMYPLAAQYKVPVLIHWESCYPSDCTAGEAELNDALTKNPSTTFIFAHTCPIDQMKAHPNLHCEHEVQATPLPSDGFDRVMVGTDIQQTSLQVGYGPGKSKHYRDTIAEIRAELAKLSPEDAERVAIGNARLLKIVE